MGAQVNLFFNNNLALKIQMQFGINFKLLRFSLKGIIALRTWKKYILF